MQVRDRAEVGDTVEVAIGLTPDLSWRPATVLSVKSDGSIGVRTTDAAASRYDEIPRERYRLKSKSRDWLARRFSEVI